MSVAGCSGVQRHPNCDRYLICRNSSVCEPLHQAALDPHWHSPNHGALGAIRGCPTLRLSVGGTHVTVTRWKCIKSATFCALPGAELHPRGQALRHFSAVADQCHQRARAPLRRSAVSAQAAGRAHRAWPRDLALPDADRAKRGRGSCSGAGSARPADGQSGGPCNLRGTEESSDAGIDDAHRADHVRIGRDLRRDRRARPCAARGRHHPVFARNLTGGRRMTDGRNASAGRRPLAVSYRSSNVLVLRRSSAGWSLRGWLPHKPTAPA